MLLFFKFFLFFISLLLFFKFFLCYLLLFSYNLSYDLKSVIRCSFLFIFLSVLANVNLRYVFKSFLDNLPSFSSLSLKAFIFLLISVIDMVSSFLTPISFLKASLCLIAFLIQFLSMIIKSFHYILFFIFH